MQTQKADANGGAGNAGHFLASPHAALVATACLILVLFAWHMQSLGQGGLSQFDEYYTYERSIGFALHNDWWSVYSSNAPTLKKPPLQYWMSAAFMQMGLSDLLALRLPSAIFGFGAFIATAMLAHAIVPQKPWAMFASVLFLASFLSIWQSLTSAMLDGGAIFFTTFGFWAFFKAWQAPKLWFLFIAATFLAGLQKGPTPLGFFVFGVLGLALTAMILPVKMPDGLSKKKLFAIFWIAFSVAFVWQFFQLARYGGPEALSGNFEGEMIGRFTPSLAAATDSDLISFARMMLGQGSEAILRGAGLLAVVALPFLTRRYELMAAVGMVAFFALIMWMASGNVYARYVLVILPLLCVCLAGTIASLPVQPIPKIAVTALFVVVSQGPIKPIERLGLAAPARFDPPLSVLLPQLPPLMSTVGAEETPMVICAQNRETRIPRGAITVYAAPRRDFHYDRDGDGLHRAQRQSDQNQMQGLCTEVEFTDYSPDLRDVIKTPIAGPYFFWRGTLK
ncbi:ArnT family glycosyltransferase [Algirhabdus cladophorae]|uniref:ArnT family glycosyltransferase n=1 Tax=Algirhabdus cladophorae TaxID=3377108 RepID=UPI003B84969F